MDLGLMQAIHFLLVEPFKFFTNITVPGTSFSLACLFLYVFLFGLALDFLLPLFGVRKDDK